MSLPKDVLVAMGELAKAQKLLSQAATEHDARTAGRTYYEALAGVCEAYLRQFVDESGLPVNLPRREQFPPEVAWRFSLMVRGWLSGHMGQSLRDLLQRRGPPGRSPIEQRAIEDACRYMQAAKGGLIADGAPVKQVGIWFGVDRATAQSWRRAEKRDLVATFMPEHGKKERAELIEARARRSGKLVARWGRSHGAITTRGKMRDERAKKAVK